MHATNGPQINLPRGCRTIQIRSIKFLQLDRRLIRLILVLVAFSSLRNFPLLWISRAGSFKNIKPRHVHSHKTAFTARISYFAAFDTDKIALRPCFWLAGIVWSRKSQRLRPLSSSIERRWYLSVPFNFPCFLGISCSTNFSPSWF
jgi:hypothetical protein